MKFTDFYYLDGVPVPAPLLGEQIDRANIPTPPPPPPSAIREDIRIPPPPPSAIQDDVRTARIPTPPPLAAPPAPGPVRAQAWIQQQPLIQDPRYSTQYIPVLISLDYFNF